MSTLHEAKKCKTVNKRKNKEARIKVLVCKITHQNKKTKVLAAKIATKKVFMTNKKPWKSKDTAF